MIGVCDCATWEDVFVGLDVDEEDYDCDGSGFIAILCPHGNRIPCPGCPSCDDGELLERLMPPAAAAEKPPT